ncbi:MAG TPA: flagellar hook-associated protein FlgK [Steroidobacteraceae bacterium]|nr:flagellar hook-associated protein FlgK [Steroidobacteraceae bacterium]
MADLLSTSVSGLLAFQQALDVTSNNISNASTPGYSVETANLAEAPGQSTGIGFVGSGVDVQSITRSYNEYLAQQVRSSQASYSSSNALATQAAQIDNMLSDSGTGLTATLQSFVNSLQGVANTPTSTSARQALLNQAQALAQQLTSYDSQISQYGAQLESQLSGDVTQINSIMANIASLNQQIAAESTNGQTPNQLMDQRDKLITQLSQYVAVQTATESNGAMDVYIGTGQALVTGGTAAKLTTVAGAYDPSQLDIAISGGGGTSADITSEISGGELGGLLSARSQVLDPARNAIGQVSVAVATLVNQQQQSGMDLSGAQGQPMFSVGGVQVLPDANNTGSAALSVTRGSLSALSTDDYKLQYTGGAWQLQDLTTGQSVAMTGNGTAASPFLAAGLAIVTSGAPAGGDSFLIQPTAAASAGFSVLLTSPSQVAAASLIQGTAGAANTGSAAVSAASVTDPSAWVADTYTVAFGAGNSYTVTNSGGTQVASGSYASGTPISFQGAKLTLTGSPASGDTITVGANNPANTGDNSNILAMTDALSAAALNGNTTSVAGAANSLISRIGVVTQQAQSNATAQQTVNQNATTALNNASGVNLDQEAANMLRFQQAYQAMAQVIQASNQMFTSLISAVAHG